jgi:hypothetical protein
MKSSFTAFLNCEQFFVIWSIESQLKHLFFFIFYFSARIKEDVRDVNAKKDVSDRLIEKNQTRELVDLINEMFSLILVVVAVDFVINVMTSDLMSDLLVFEKTFSISRFRRYSRDFAFTSRNVWSICIHKRANLYKSIALYVSTTSCF